MYTSKSSSDKRALITGATGYVGSNLVRHLLAQSWDVHIITRPDSDLKVLEATLSNITVHRHDATSLGMVEVLAKAKPEVVFHLASKFLVQHETEEIDALIGSNLLFSTQLAEAMAVNGVKYFVNTGTSWQHYNNESYSPVNLYAATKQAFEDMLDYYIEAYDLKATTLYLFDTYGPDDHRAKLISLLWKSAITQQPLSMSPGEQMIDLVHIDDVMRAYTQAADALLTQESGHTRFGISSGRPMRLIDLIEVFQRATKKSLPITFGGRPYRAREVMQTWRSYKKLPGWTPRIQLSEGLLTSKPKTINST